LDAIEYLPVTASATETYLERGQLTTETRSAAIYRPNFLIKYVTLTYCMTE